MDGVKNYYRLPKIHVLALKSSRHENGIESVPLVYLVPVS